MTTTIRIVSVGRIASQLNCAPELVIRSSNYLGIGAAYEINGIDHFLTSDIEAIGAKVRELQKPKQN